MERTNKIDKLNMINQITHLDIENVRKHFPILNRLVHGKQLVYLDNGATTQKPSVVIESLIKHYSENNANIHRGVHKLSEESTLAYEDARSKVARFINAEDCEIVFTKNATESLNLLAYSLGETLREGDEIILSVMEHHANLVPWQQLAKRKKIVLKFVGLEKNGSNKLDLEELRNLLNERTRIVSLTHLSNVLGTVNDVHTISKMVHSVGARFIVDASQSVSRMKIDVNEIDCDFLVFTGHKLYGPTGVGVLYGKKDLLKFMPPFLTGGDMIKSVSLESSSWNDVPWKFEAGTPPIAEAIALGRSIEYVIKIGIDNINLHEKELIAYARQKFEDLDYVTVYSPSLESHIGVISFNVERVHSHDVASLLDNEGIAIRSGHHCAQPLVNYLGIKDCARISFGLYNTKEEVDKFIIGLKKVKTFFGEKIKVKNE